MGATAITLDQRLFHDLCGAYEVAQNAATRSWDLAVLRVSGGLFAGHTDVFVCPCKLALLAHRFGACAARKLWGPCADACRINLPLGNRFYTRSADISH